MIRWESACGRMAVRWDGFETKVQVEGCWADGKALTIDELDQLIARLKDARDLRREVEERVLARHVMPVRMADPIDGWRCGHGCGHPREGHATSPNRHGIRVLSCPAEPNRYPPTDARVKQTPAGYAGWFLKRYGLSCEAPEGGPSAMMVDLAKLIDNGDPRVPCPPPPKTVAVFYWANFETAAPFPTMAAARAYEAGVLQGAATSTDRVDGVKTYVLPDEAAEMRQEVEADWGKLTSHAREQCEQAIVQHERHLNRAEDSPCETSRPA